MKRSATENVFVSRWYLLIILLIASSAGCSKPFPKPLPPQVTSITDYDLTATNISFQTATDRKGGKKLNIKLSVINRGTSASPERAFSLDVYIDGRLTLFDHATSGILSHQQTDYSYAVDLPAGHHAYSILLTPLIPGGGVDKRTNEIVGTFDTQ